MSNDDNHRKLTKKIEQILRNAGFETDREVDINIKENTTEEKFNLDVCAIYKEVLIIVECKAGSNIKLRNLILEWITKKGKIEKGSVKVIASAYKKIKTGAFKGIEEVNVLFAINNFEITPENYDYAKSEKMHIWNATAIDYFIHTASALGIWTKYEIMKELEIKPPERKKFIITPAIEIKQPGGKCYLTCISPFDLLKIAYVHRRSLGEKEAYQRIIKKDRIEDISQFLSRNVSRLSNNIILAFESNVELNEEKTELTIPIEYCSAWIVDGQHRLFGFTRTTYCQEEKKYDIPIVAFINLPSFEQTRMFIDINNNQKKMDRTLLSDLMTIVKDMREPLTWVSLLVKELNKNGVWKDRIQILELQRGRSINLYSFARYALLQRLLKPIYKNGKLQGFSGPLFRYAQFNYKKLFDNPVNKKAFELQVNLLQTYFGIVAKLLSHKNSKRNKWNNFKKYGITKATGVNALLLVLNKILDTGKSFDELKIGKFLEPIKKVRLTNESIKRYGRGWDSYQGLANAIIEKLNNENENKLALYI